MPATAPFRETLGYLNWLFNPFQRVDVVGVYDLLGTRAATAHALFLNLGYWSAAEDLDQASAALAGLVADTARLTPTDTVLDVGFGFGDQDLQWARTHNPAQIIGLNITQSQVAVARARVAECGLAERIQLLPGSATALPLAADSVDKVLAVECAFHFRSRATFFAEAWRVLRPGGRLVLADIIPLPQRSGTAARLRQRLSWGLTAGKFSIPWDNAYPRPTYHARLATAGFEQIDIQSIRDHVYAPLHAWLRANPQAIGRLHPAVGFAARTALRFDADSVYAGLDYVLASAVKPLRLIEGGTGRTGSLKTPGGYAETMTSRAP